MPTRFAVVWTSANIFSLTLAPVLYLLAYYSTHQLPPLAQEALAPIAPVAAVAFAQALALRWSEMSGAFRGWFLSTLGGGESPALGLSRSSMR